MRALLVRRRCLLAAALSCGLLACSCPEERVKRSARTARSWESTLRLTAHELERGVVTRVYARQILDAALAAWRTEARRPAWNGVAREIRLGWSAALAQLASSFGEARPPVAPR